MTDKDLNINNYNYPEILGIFNVGRDFKYSILQDIETKMVTIKQKLTYDYYLFYQKAYKMIWIIHQLYAKDIIQDSDNINHIEYYVSNIKKIDNYESQTIDKILELLNVNKPALVKHETVKETHDESGIEKRIYDLLQKQIVNSYQYPVAPSTLNQIKRVTHFKNLNMNSCFRVNYKNTLSTDCQFVIPSDIKNVVSMRLASIEIPNSWYLYTAAKQSNYFKIIITQSGVTDTYVITIPDGNYDNNSLPLYLNSTYLYQSTTSTNLNQIKCSVDIYSLETTFSIINNNIANISMTIIFFEPPNNNMLNTFGWQAGFREHKYENITNAKGITSEGIFDAGGDRYVYVSINDYQNSNNTLNMVCMDNSMMEEDIIGKIPIINGKFSIVITESNTLVKTRRYNGPVNIRNLYVKILDRFGDVIDLNSMDFSFTLELEILYEKFN